MAHNNTSRAEAERLLGISEKLLETKDLNGSKDFALLAQETEPLLDGPDQILAITEVLLASQKRINNNHHTHDWYAILGLDHRSSSDLEFIKKQYRRLALLLHPDKNRYTFADTAFKLVADAWAVLSDHTKKLVFDNEVVLKNTMHNSQTRIDLENKHHQQQKQHQQQHQQQKQHQQQHQQHYKLPVWRGVEGGVRGHDTGPRMLSFWTPCPYCYNLYEYPKVYEGCCLRCQNCKRAFSAVGIPSLPPLVPGKEEYYCSYGFFPVSFACSGFDENDVVPNWVPVMVPTGPTREEVEVGLDSELGEGVLNFADGNVIPISRKKSRPMNHV